MTDVGVKVAEVLPRVSSKSRRLPTEKDGQRTSRETHVKNSNSNAVQQQHSSHAKPVVVPAAAEESPIDMNAPVSTPSEIAWLNTAIPGKVSFKTAQQGTTSSSSSQFTPTPSSELILDHRSGRERENHADFAARVIETLNSPESRRSSPRNSEDASDHRRRRDSPSGSDRIGDRGRQQDGDNQSKKPSAFLVDLPPEAASTSSPSAKTNHDSSSSSSSSKRHHSPSESENEGGDALSYEEYRRRRRERRLDRDKQRNAGRSTTNEERDHHHQHRDRSSSRSSRHNDDGDHRDGWDRYHPGGDDEDDLSDDEDLYEGLTPKQAHRLRRRRKMERQIEKQQILLELKRRWPDKLSREYTIEDSIHILRSERDAHINEENTKGMTELGCDMLVVSTHFVEYCSFIARRYVRLQGWGDAVEEDITKYRPVIEAIYRKHFRYRASGDPVKQLICMLLFSAVVHHWNTEPSAEPSHMTSTVFSGYKLFNRFFGGEEEEESQDPESAKSQSQAPTTPENQEDKSKSKSSTKTASQDRPRHASGSDKNKSKTKNHPPTPKSSSSSSNAAEQSPIPSSVVPPPPSSPLKSNGEFETPKPGGMKRPLGAPR
jgi:hypothetical protein